MNSHITLMAAAWLVVHTVSTNTARCISGLGRRFMMDLADEIGFLVYDESYAGWCVTPSPQMTRRWNQTVAGMIRRDRNHPSVVMWGLLNETGNDPVFMHAMDSLEFVKQLDDTRVVMLNSGRFDGMMLDRPDAVRQRLPEAWVMGRPSRFPLSAATTRAVTSITMERSSRPAPSRCTWA